MEQPAVPKVEPSEFRKQSKFVGLIGLVMDVLVATVIIAFQPFEQTVTYVLTAALVGVGLVLTYVFVIMFPKKYDRYYVRMLEPKMK
jgi:uncharacterized protein YqhQ